MKDTDHSAPGQQTRSRKGFRQRDLERALRATRAAGLNVEAIDITLDGCISIRTTNGEEQPLSSALVRWQPSRAQVRSRRSEYDHALMLVTAGALSSAQKAALRVFSSGRGRGKMNAGTVKSLVRKGLISAQEPHSVTEKGKRILAHIKDDDGS